MSPRRALNVNGELAEAAWQAQVIGLARFYGWRLAHFHDSRREVRGRGGSRLVGDRDAAGFPDLVLVRGPELIYAELKTDRGRTSAEQDGWLDALRVVAEAVRHVADTALNEDLAPEAGYPAVDVYIWRPRDFDDVEARLARGRHRQPATFAP